MRANEVFGWLGPERAPGLLREMKEKAPSAAAIALAAAAEAFKLRPQFLRQQPLAKRAEWMRRALSRRAAAGAAEQVLADYILSAHRELLVELLDGFGVKHEDGELEESSPDCPKPAKLKKAVTDFRKGENAETRELLLRAFASQAAIEWEPLEALLEKD
jgi:hypothetical protein